MKNIIILAVLLAVLIVAVLGFLLFSIRPFDSFEEVLGHIKQTREVVTYFEKDCSLRVGQDEEGKIFRIRKEDFDRLCRCLEPEGWKSEVWFTTPRTGRVRILYGRNLFPPAVKWMKDHGEEAAEEADRLVRRHRMKKRLYFLVPALLFLIICGLAAWFVR